MHRNKLISAAAGSGKTTFLVNEALKQRNTRVLITTYTQANEHEIRRKIIEANRCIPENVNVQTWFSFLLQHGVRPFQGCLYEGDIKGVILVNSQSGMRYLDKGKPVYFSENKNFERHYFTVDMKMYTDKISKFAVRCNQKTNGDVVDRLSRIYPAIFIDEVQDLAGYDLELLKVLLESSATVLLVGDPRQGTYSTNSAPKNKKYRKSEIVNFFGLETTRITIDSTSLNINHRCVVAICELSNRLYPTLDPVTSGNDEKTEHDGVFLVKNKDVALYLEKYNAMQLRNSVSTRVEDGHAVMNFGEAKGLAFDRVLIYPTRPFIEWLIDAKATLAPTSRSKFYVAITRARQSVGIVYDDDKVNIAGVRPFN